MTLRIRVVIPSSDYDTRVARLTREVLDQTPFAVDLLLPNDLRPSKGVFEHPRLRLETFDPALGRGRALRALVDRLVAEGVTHLLTLDVEGRHLAAQIPKLVAEAEAHPWDLILGNRGLAPAEGGGWFQRVSRKVLRSAVCYETGTHVRDPRSTFRLYPLFALQTMPLRFAGEGFELEILIRSIWRGFAVREIAVAIAEAGADSIAAPKHGFRGALRLSLLNVMLVCLSLLRTHNAPFELALAIGLGIFVGCTPVFGFHTLMVVALAVGLRLNFVALWLGTHVSTPVLIPLVLWAEFYIGEHWLGIAGGKGMVGHIWQWTAGATVLGLLLGVPGALLAYFLSRSMQRKTTSRAGGRSSLRYRLLALITRRFGARVAYVYLRVASVTRYLQRLNARRGLDQFHRALEPDLGFWRRQGRIIRHLRVIGELHVDHIARGVRLPAGISLDDTPGDLKMSAHFGGLGADAGLSRTGRTWFIDQAGASGGELLPFLGKLGWFCFGASPRGDPAVREAVFLPRTEDGSYRVSRFDPHCAGVDWRRALVARLEEEVRARPEQWLNAYPFFSAKPIFGADGESGTEE